MKRTHYKAVLFYRHRKLKQYLLDRDISQADFALKMSWSDAYVSQLLSRHPLRGISEKQALLIEAVLRMPPGYLSEAADV